MFDPKSAETVGYHIFVEPEGVLRLKLQRMINLLAEMYDGPVFTPHVTLLPRIVGHSEQEIIEKTKVLAKSMSPYSLSLAEIKGEPAFFRALYIEVENPAQLQKYHETANELFGLTDVNQYKPHLSLYYGNIHNEVRAEMINAITYNSGDSFSVNKLHVYHTPGDAQTWRKVDEILIN